VRKEELGRGRAGDGEAGERESKRGREEREKEAEERRMQTALLISPIFRDPSAGSLTEVHLQPR
jgi:hypothetical protein